MKPFSEMAWTELLELYHKLYGGVCSNLWQMVARGFGEDGDVHLAAAREDLNNIERIRAEFARREAAMNSDIKNEKEEEDDESRG